MDEQAESWRTLTTLSPFLLPLASAIVVLLIRDLLNPRQWQRYVRKIFFAALAGTVVFGFIVAGYLFLVQQVGSEDSPIVISATVVVALAIIPATVFAIVMTFERVEPNADWYLNSRFRYSFQNDSWPVLSVDVPFECLPQGATFINGRIAAVRESVGQYRLRVTVGTGNETRVLLDHTTRNPRPAWMRLMRVVLRAQLGDLKPTPGWQERVPFLGRLRSLFMNQDRTPATTRESQYKWQDFAYLQIHRLAQRMEASGVPH